MTIVGKNENLIGRSSTRFDDINSNNNINNIKLKTVGTKKMTFTIWKGGTYPFHFLGKFQEDRGKEVYVVEREVLLQSTLYEV